MAETNQKRNTEIFNERLAGRTYKSIGDEFGLSTNRVKQICDREMVLMERESRREQKRLQQEERDKYLDEHGRLDALTPRLYYRILRGGADTKDKLVEMLCSGNGIEVKYVGNKGIAELEAFVGFRIKRVMKYTTTPYGFTYLSGSVLKKEVDPQ